MPKGILSRNSPEGYHLKIVEKLRLGKFATFAPNLKLPVHNWFYFKEGFSRDLVLMLAENFSFQQGDWILDPFCGVGTTALSCIEAGINSVNFDTHPLMLFVTRVKTQSYDEGELRLNLKKLLKIKFEIPEVSAPEFVSRFFPRRVMGDILFLREQIQEIEDEKTKNFFLLCLVNTTMRCSYVVKDGAVVKIHKRAIPPIRRIFRRDAIRMLWGVGKLGRKSCKTRVEFCDARELKLGDCSVDGVITSPPYLYKSEYLKACKIEGYLLGLSNPDPKHVVGRGEWNAEELGEIQDFAGDLDPQVKIYFRDLMEVLKELYRVSKDGARLVLAVADGCSSNGVVEVGENLSGMAERVGFDARQMVVVNKRPCVTPWKRRIGVARESLLVWEK
jgi:DNA modification methylase